jgi:hypothetical protein
MIKIPFDRCVILTTLDFEQISERLATAIYDPRSPQREIASSRKQERYSGHIHGFKFSASPLLGHKYLHLPSFLFPSIEGNIHALANGYEISLTAKLQNFTFVLLLTGLGGILTACSIAFEKVLLNIHDAFHGRSLLISVLLYLATIAYFYFASWQTTKFFKALFTQGLTGVSRINVPQVQQWSPGRSQTNMQKPPSDRFES